MAEGKTAKIEPIKREFGKDFLETLSHNAASSPLHAVEELVANSWDADATSVRITYQGGRLSIEDNGSGMSPDEIPDFYRVGDSKKVGKASPGGRNYFGSFGIATLSLRMLAERYTLETIKNGEKTIVTETFPKRLTLEDRIEPETFKTKEEKNGTKIHLEMLKVSEKSGFTPDKLINHLAWAMPIDEPNFTLTVNGTTLVPKAIESAHKFDFKFNGEIIGPANGIIYLTKSAIKEAGIYVMVNKRRIGNPKEIVNLNELNDSTARRIVARISADGLSKYIMANRGGFRPSEAFDEFRTALVTQLKEVFRFDDHHSQSKKQLGLVRVREGILKDTKNKLVKAQVEEVVGGAKIKFSQELPSHIPSRFDPNENAIILNQTYPTISTDAVSNSATLRAGIMISTVEALARHRATQGKGTIEEFEKHKLLMLNMVRKSSSSKQAPTSIFPSLHYSQAAVAELSGQSLTTIRYLADNKALETQMEEIIGGSYIRLANDTKGLVPLPEFVTHLMAKRILTTGSNLYNQMGRFGEIFEEMGENAHPFVRRYRDSKAYFVESSCEEGLAKQIMEVHRRTSSPKEVRNILRAYGSRELTAKEIEGEVKLNGYSLPKIETHAKEQGLTLRTKSGQNPKYNLGDIVSVIQNIRGNTFSSLSPTKK